MRGCGILLKIKTLSIILLLLLALFFSQNEAKAQCSDIKLAFKVGETLNYEVYYNWGFIWLNAAQVEFSVHEKYYKSRPVYHLFAYGSTHKNYDVFFKVREKYEAYLDKESLLPLWSHRNAVEDSYTAIENYFFDYKRNILTTIVSTRGKPAVSTEIPITPCLLDLMSAVYIFRSKNFTNVKKGDTFPINAVIDNKTYDLSMRYEGKESVTTKEKQTFSCLKFAVELVEGTIFKKGEEALIYVTDDAKRTPIMVEAKIIVGSVKVFYKSGY